MDYEKKYKALVGKIKNAYLYAQTDSTKAVLEDILSELKESEDENIRKEIVRFIQMEVEDEIVGNKWLAWLEKQSEPSDKGEISDGFHTFNELYYYRMLYNAAFFNMLPKEWVHKSKKHNDGEECFGGGWFIVMANLPTGQISNHYELKDWDLFQIPEKERADKWDGHTPQEAAERLHNFLLKKQGEKPQGKTALEAIKEEKVDNANKVEPKFKVGDWIVEPRKGEHNCIWHIDRIEKNSYWEGHVGVFIEHADKYYHLWTIADAKDGDVLASNVLISKYNKPFIYNGNHNSTHVGAYCGISTENRFNVATKKCRWTANVNIRPATKEQRDLLFQKMRKAGYEWDAEKKGLKLLITNGGDFESENCEQNPAWSEEDEQRIKKVMHIISCDGRIDNKECKSMIDWLESLKDRYTWKPSNIQMECLYDAINHYHINGYPASKLSELYEQMSKIYKL